MVTSRYEWKFSSGTKIYKQTNNQIRGDKTQKQQIFFKNKVNLVNYSMKRIIFCRNKAQFIKILPFSCMEENDLSNSIWTCVWIIYNFSASVICQRSCRISVLFAHFLWEKFWKTCKRIKIFFCCKNRNPEKTVKVHIHQTLYWDTASSKHYQKNKFCTGMCLNTLEKYVVYM